MSSLSSITTPCGLEVVGCWTKAGLASCVHIKGQLKGEDLLFDCGLVDPSTFSAAHVFCSHGHIDHIGAIVTHARARALTHSPASYYMPLNCIAPIQAVKAAFEVLDGREIPMVLIAIEVNQVIEIPRTRLSVKAFPTVHRVPSQGYAVYCNTTPANSLLPIYQRSSREEIKELLASGVAMYQSPTPTLQLCYTGDTVMEGLLQEQNAFLFTCPLLILEATYLDGAVSKAVDRGHIHIQDIASNAELFQNDHILIVHLSQKYAPYSRAIHLLRSSLPPSLLSRTSVSLFSFGSGTVSGVAPMYCVEFGCASYCR